MKKFFWAALFFISSAFGQEIIETRLDNGLKIILKPLENHEEEILFQMIAKGGFASLPPEQQPSGKLAPDIVWEVGLDDMSAAQISAKLYRAGSEVVITFHPLYRKIEGSLQESGLKSTLEVVKLIFTEPKLSDGDLKEGLRLLKVGYKPEKFNPILSLDAETRLLNSGNWTPFVPLSEKSLNQISLETVRSFYSASFADPEDFLLVMVGAFDSQKVLEELKATLGTLPKSPKSALFKTAPPFPPFPSSNESVKQKIFQKGRADTVIRLSFPLELQVNPKSMKELELLSKTLALRLRHALDDTKGSKNGVDVSYEFPFYPYFDSAWLLITLYADPKEAKELRDKLLEALKELKKEGPTEEELQKARFEIGRTKQFWEQENDYWLLHLTQSYLENGSQLELQESSKPAKLTAEEAKTQLNQLLPQETYTQIIFTP